VAAEAALANDPAFQQQIKQRLLKEVVDQPVLDVASLVMEVHENVQMAIVVHVFVAYFINRRIKQK
jgi:hypothetical protein